MKIFNGIQPGESDSAVMAHGLIGIFLSAFMLVAALVLSVQHGGSAYIIGIPVATIMAAYLVFIVKGYCHIISRIREGNTG